MQQRGHGGLRHRNGTATAGSDYVTASGALTFAAGETVKTVVVDLADDARPKDWSAST